MGFLCAALLLCAARGPREQGWYGWGGGWSLRKSTDEEVIAEKQSQAGGEKDSESGDAPGVPSDQGGRDHGHGPDAEENREGGQGSESGEQVMKVSADIDLSKTEKGRFAGMCNK